MNRQPTEMKSKIKKKTEFIVLLDVITIKDEKIANSKKRPKLDFLNDKNILKLINLRSKIYLRADYKLNCDNLNKFQITKKILNIYENKENFN